MLVKTKIVSNKELFEIVYGSGGMPKDTSIFHRIRFFSHANLNIFDSEDSLDYFVVLLKGKKIIGLASVGYYSMDSSHPKELSISFLSIDVDYRGNGYAKLIVKELFKYAKKIGLDIKTSTYTVLGKIHLQLLFNEFAVKYSVKFTDKNDEDSLMDNTRAYGNYKGLLVHKDEIKMKELQK